jgi:hypothetical protein
MKADSSITTAEAYLASLPEPRRTMMQTLHDSIRATLPDLEPFIIYGMLGYGHYLQKIASGKEVESCVFALASQKQYISLYLGSCDSTYSMAKMDTSRLGKVNVGKCCIRFRKLSDLNLPVALKLIKESRHSLTEGKHLLTR